MDELTQRQDSIRHIVYRSLPKQSVPCACCGGENFRVATRGDRYAFGLTTVVCTRCGLIFTNPRPADAWFDEFYREHYRKYYEDVVEPDDAYLQRNWIQGRHGRNVRWLLPHLPPTGALLDVGCAEGTFLHQFQSAFPQWQVHGLEPSPVFSEFARKHYGLKAVRTATFEEMDTLPEHAFDLITANHVLEHLLDPNFLFSRARRLLAPKGLLFVDVPDSDGTAAGLWRLHIAHVYHFTEQSLTNFLGKHGFSLVNTARGNEQPAPWTLQILARREEALPKDWRPPPVDSHEIAKRFARLCHRTFWMRLRVGLHRWRKRMMGKRRKPETAGSNGGQ